MVILILILVGVELFWFGFWFFFFIDCFEIMIGLLDEGFCLMFGLGLFVVFGRGGNIIFELFLGLFWVEFGVCWVVIGGLLGGRGFGMVDFSCVVFG